MISAKTMTRTVLSSSQEGTRVPEAPESIWMPCLRFLGRLSQRESTDEENEQVMSRHGTTRSSMNKGFHFCFRRRPFLMYIREWTVLPDFF